tara:strand:+ start:228 stop:482 length:255 start_codon:yes stop_codon:yes gene_type:complete
MKTNNKGIHFADEPHKIVDMIRTSEDDFLMSYSYLSKEDYDETIKFILILIKEHWQKKYPNHVLKEVMDLDTFDEMHGDIFKLI